MDEVYNSRLYGLELQARALAPQYGDNNEVRFFVASNSLQSNNQIHLVEYTEEGQAFRSKLFEHPHGPVWKLNASPHNKNQIATCYQKMTISGLKNRAALLTIAVDESPDDDDTNVDLKTELATWHHVELLNTDRFGDKTKTVEFHPNEPNILACVVDSKVIVYNRGESDSREVAIMGITAGKTKNVQPFTGGKWSLHHQGQVFVTLYNNHIRAYDVRDNQEIAYFIEDAHGQLVRDIDFNPNKQCHFVSGGDDGFIKIWDCRMCKGPVFSRQDHAHWVWCVRFNTFHDQLILSSSSDCRVLLTCAASVSSEILIELNSSTSTKMPCNDSLLHTFDHHDDSVYCVEWSNVDPWIFASLSYDGCLLISKIPKQYKYQFII